MKHYYYLLYSLVFLAIFLFILYMRKDLKPHILVPCLFGAIIGPISELMYLTDYWRPYTLFGHSTLAIADTILASSIIGTTLILYPLVFKRRIWEKHHKRHVTFSISYMALGAAMILLLYNLGINSVLATAISAIVLIIPLFMMRRDIIGPSLVSGLLITVVACLIYTLGIGYLLQNVWSLNGTEFGYKIGYIPLTEIIWYFTVGAFLEAFDLYIYDAHYRRFIKERAK